MNKIQPIGGSEMQLTKLSKKQKKQYMVIGTIILVAFSIFLFFYENIRIPRVRKNTEALVRQQVDIVAMPKKSVAVVVDPNGIGKYTEFTQEVIDKYIKIVEVPEAYVIGNPVLDLGKLNGKVTQDQLRKGEQIPMDILTDVDTWYGDFDRVKEYNITSTVAGELQSGNVVDLVVSYKNGDYDVVISKKKIKKIIDISKEEEAANQQAQSQPNTPTQGQATTQTVQQNTNTSSGVKTEGLYKIIIDLNEAEYERMELAKFMGALEPRIYLDETQKATPITFDVRKAKLKLGLLDSSIKPSNLVDSSSTNSQVTEGAAASDTTTTPQNNK
jgi:hypothetical protein